MSEGIGYLVTFVRAAHGQWHEPRPFGPRPDVGAGARVWSCPLCNEVFRPGDYTTLVALGPGPDAEERAKCARGGFYNACAIELHWACATGLPDPETPPA